jgi:enediyne polyketide synthase
MTGPIAIVGMACEFPGARSPLELWEDTLAQRRAFRRLPPERLRLEDYYSDDRDAPDRTYAVEAGVIEGYEFDRIGFRVAASTYRSADQAHWLALDVATRALRDAGYELGEGLPLEATGVFLGNTLTGEFSRAGVMRLRWPYVGRTLDAALDREGWDAARRREFLQGLEAEYKAPFPPVGEESLAGGLSNTIAGRICNHFDLKGGGFTVDGACASSLLAVSQACAALESGDLDVALAGGVDLSLDPFELVGFAKAGALASDEMRPYDARSAGFWPGEGCGFVVLMRLKDAIGLGRRSDVVIRGWGISSDGRGGLTRPEVEGQMLALRRAYRRAGFGIDTVSLFEGHGTGTAVGDATELQALGRARREASAHAPPAVIGTIKANIGHTKAAAGVAGLIKAAMALRAEILPPLTNCGQPHAELSGESPALRVLDQGEPWPLDRPLRAGVSAMGFGGINAHVVLEGTARRAASSPGEMAILGSAQDAELFLLDASDFESLGKQVEKLLMIAPRLSRSELTDLAAMLARSIGDGPTRASVVASKPSELAQHLETLRGWIAEGVAPRVEPLAGLFLGVATSAPRIGFLFPGQGSPSHLDGGAIRRRFPAARGVYDRADLPHIGDRRSTEIAQPAIVAASLAALVVLESLGVDAGVAVGHSLGELTALRWAGAFDDGSLLRVATARGRAFAGVVGERGAMASLAASRSEVESLRNGAPAVIAGLNAPRQTVIAGSDGAIGHLVARAQARGIVATRLPVSHAFHSPLVASAVPRLAEALSLEEVRPLRREVISTVTGSRLDRDEDVRALLTRQVTAPVRFLEAVTEAAEDVDLWIEVGPGRVLSGLVSQVPGPSFFLPLPLGEGRGEGRGTSGDQQTGLLPGPLARPRPSPPAPLPGGEGRQKGTLQARAVIGTEMAPSVAIDAGGPSLVGLLSAVGAAFALGARISTEALFEGRITRPFDPDRTPKFFANPCEQAPLSASFERSSDRSTVRWVSTEQSSEAGSRPSLPASALELVRSLVASRSALPLASVEDGHRLLSDLHLNSILVGQVVADACRALDLPPPVAPTHFADASVAELARALEDLARVGGSKAEIERPGLPAGVDGWVRPFTVAMIESALTRPRAAEAQGCWRVLAPPGHPLAARLAELFEEERRGSGIVACLPPEPDESSVGFLLEAARLAIASGSSPRFVLVQHGGGGAAFARSLHLEAPGIATCVVDVPIDHQEAASWIVAEATSAEGYTETHYDANGRRSEPFLRLLPIADHPASPILGPSDVVLVSGGGKGIAAESALGLAIESGCKLALVGRSRPELDAGLLANLRRLEAAGVTFRYVAADVVEPAELASAVREAERALGPITAIVHGAGTNVPKLLTDLDEAAFLQTLAPKVRGLQNLLDAIEPSRLRLLVTFGSIIARTGMRGEADYATANEWLAMMTERFAAEHPSCRCLALEWSVWSGVGMGERLGTVEALAREGITPIPPGRGVELLRDLTRRSLPTAVVVTGRFGSTPTLKPEPMELPFLRFLERPRASFKGVELVIDAELSAATDPYVADHVFQGERLFPAVLGLEAMAQAARSLVTGASLLAFEDVRFDRPVSVPDSSVTTIRLAALAREPGRVEVALRCSTTGFQVDHFRAFCRFGTLTSESPPSDPGGSYSDIPLDPGTDLYGAILFQGGRFQRVLGYRRLASTACVAEVASRDATDAWFGPYLPPALLLGDPASRDAAIHAIQACIPHRTILPIGVDRIRFGEPTAPGHRIVTARETSHQGDTFTYDLEIADSEGRVFERWEGLRLRAMSGADFHGPWAVPLIGPYLERRVAEVISGPAISAVLIGGTGDRRDRSRAAFDAVLGHPARLCWRPDGKPEVDGERAVSSSHAGDLTLAVAAFGEVGCDIEPVRTRHETSWRDLLGPDRFALARQIVLETGEGLDAAATRVWAASEAIEKAGAMLRVPLVLVAGPGHVGRVLLAAGTLLVAIEVIRVRGVEDPLAVAIAARDCHARL